MDGRKFSWDVDQKDRKTGVGVGVGNSSRCAAVARPSGIRETRGSIPSLALSFLLPQLGQTAQYSSRERRSR